MTNEKWHAVKYQNGSTSLLRNFIAFKRSVIWIITDTDQHDEPRIKINVLLQQENYTSI